MPLSEDAQRAFLVEYEQCMESYRHTYTTIWQAGALFAAISAAVLAFGTRGGTTILVTLIGSRPAADGGEFWLTALAPVPFLFWYLGIFLPMNRYGEVRATRLADIEKTLSAGIPDLNMKHYINYNDSRPDRTGIRRLVAFQAHGLRVHEVVNAFCIGVLIADLIWVVAHIV